MLRHIILALTLTLTVFSTSAEARKYRPTTSQQPLFSGENIPSLATAFNVFGNNTPREQRNNVRHTRVSREATIIGGRPSGCPHRFCGCGASLYKFGRIIPDLNLAWNWARKFPRIAMEQAGNGDAAVRKGHVAIVLENLGGGNFRLHDSNSGGGRTRIHVRNLAGYVFVRPSQA